MLIQQINWLTRARKAAGSKGPAQAELLEDVSQYILVDDVSGFEHDWSGGVKQMINAGIVAAVVGQVSFVSLFNPPGSGVLAFIDTLEVASSSVGQLVFDTGWRYTDTAPAIRTPFHQDSRFGITVPAVGDVSSLITRDGTNAVGQLVNQDDRLIILGVQAAVRFPRKKVLIPGTAYVIQTPVNTQLFYTLQWKERPAESGELPST